MKGWKIFVLVLAVYGVSVFGGFIQDDVKVIESDPEMGRVSALLASFARPYYYMDDGTAGAYRPLTSFSFYLNALVTGEGAWGFHLVNILIYAGVCVLVFEVLKKFFSEKSSFWGALIFAVLPIHTEAVSNIVGRAELLSLGLVLSAILFQFQKKWEMSALILLLALLSKETAIVGLPILTYLMILGKEKRETKIGVVSFYILVTISYLFLRAVVLGGGGIENNATVVENPLKFMSSDVRVMNALALVPFGIGKILFPWHLSYDYSFNQVKLISSWFDWRVLLGGGLILLSIGSLLTKFRKDRAWILGQAFFWGPLAVTGNFLFPVGTVFGERLWFWPSLGIIMLATQLLRSCHLHTFLARRNISPASKFSGTQCLRSISNGRHAVGTLHNPVKKGIGFVAFFIVVLFAGRTVVRNVDWLSQERLFIHDAMYASDSVLAQSNAAAMYLMKKDFVKGKELLEKASLIYPKYPELMNNWGMYYWWKGDSKTAKEKFEYCLKEKPGFGLCVGNMKLVK
jgi:hypothetical protein